MSFTIGADPEIFVKKNGKSITPLGLMPGTKAEPHKTSHGAVQVDGMAAEFNIDPTGMDDFEGFNQNIVRTIADLRTILGDANINLAIQPTMDFDPEYLKAQPTEATELGCDPDYNAYTLLPNPRPDGDVSFRTAAGHVHIGWGADIPVDNREHMEICAGFVKMLDATVGMFMTYIDRDPRRRELYGKAGAMRMKPYGVEYRTPSNLWIRNRSRRAVFHGLVRKAIQKHSSGYSVDSVIRTSETNVVDTINKGDFHTAEYILDNFLIGGNIFKEWREIKTEMAKEAMNG